ncbi:MAG: PorT family protein [Tannerella sp.]|jgi:hypothetical protein|nr:PorT family protein [Tannerella sp.]
MKNLSIIIVCTLLSLFQLKGQEHHPCWEFKINGGFNTGGTLPIPLSVEIRKIESYRPSPFAPHVALEVIRWFNKKWGVSTQITLDYKGFKVKDRVKNLHTEIEMADEKYIGNFTGKNETRINNSYITVPVMANYRFSDKWTAQLGLYIGYLYNSGFKGTASDGYIRRGSPIGEKTIVDNAAFDFSENMNKFDFGLQIAGEWEFHHNFGLRGQITWGTKPIFPADFTAVSFDMYNIYGMLGLSYRLKTK